MFKNTTASSKIAFNKLISSTAGLDSAVATEIDTIVEAVEATCESGLVHTAVKVAKIGALTKLVATGLDITGINAEVVHNVADTLIVGSALTAGAVFTANYVSASNVFSDTEEAEM